LEPEDLGAECERAEARRRTEFYQGDREPPRVEQRDVIVCDDGLATGVTARAAVRHLRGRRPRTLVFAAPGCA
jgi:predicted phosphoribosyltransferase